MSKQGKERYNMTFNSRETDNFVNKHDRIEPRKKLSLVRRIIGSAFLGLPLMLAACGPESTKPTTTAKPTPGGVEAATDPASTPEPTSTTTPEVTATAKPTETKEQEITSETKIVLKSYPVNKKTAEVIFAGMVSPTGKDESVVPVKIPMNDLLYGQDNTAFLELLRTECPELWTNLMSTASFNGKTMLNAEGSLSFKPNFSLYPTDAIIYVHLTENTDPDTKTESPYLATVEIRTISDNGPDDLPNNSALDVTISRNANGKSIATFKIIAPDYEENQTVEAAYTFQVTEENTKILRKFGLSIYDSDIGKTVIMKLPPAVAMSIGVEPQVTRYLNDEKIKAEAERLLNQNPLEALLENSQLIAEVNTDLYPEFKDRFGPIAFSLHISDLLPGTDYSAKVYDPERMFLFTASNLWLSCTNTKQCDPNLSLEEFIAKMVSPEGVVQDWHVINAKTQELEMFTGLNIHEIDVAISHYENKNDSEIKYQYSSGPQGDFKISVQYDPDKPGKLTVVGQFSEIVLGEAKHDPSILNTHIALTLVPRMTLPHYRGGDEANTTADPLLSSMPGKPYQKTRDLYIKDSKGEVKLALRIFNDIDPNPQATETP